MIVTYPRFIRNIITQNQGEPDAQRRLHDGGRQRDAVDGS